MPNPSRRLPGTFKEQNQGIQIFDIANKISELLSADCHKPFEERERELRRLLSRAAVIKREVTAARQANSAQKGAACTQVEQIKQIADTRYKGILANLEALSYSKIMDEFKSVKDAHEQKSSNAPQVTDTEAAVAISQKKKPKQRKRKSKSKLTADNVEPEA